MKQNRVGTNPRKLAEKILRESANHPKNYGRIERLAHQLALDIVSAG